MSEQQLPPSQYTVKHLYYDLSAIYSCKFGDNLQEINAAIEELSAACNRGVTTETFIKKMRQLKAITTDFQSKLSTHILNRYWEKEYISPVEFRPFRHEEDDDTD